MSLGISLRPLLCRGLLLPGESLLSYLNRLAAVNCYEPASILIKVFDKHLAALGLRDNLAYPKHPETFDMLASLTCLSPRELANASVHYFAHAPILTKMERSRIYLSDGAPFQLLSRLIRSRHVLWADYAQFCPDCLREAAYHHLAWMLKDVSGCLKHQRILANCCQNCRFPVHIRDIARGQCSECDADLTSMATDPIWEPFGLSAQRTIQVWWGLDAPSVDGIIETLPQKPPPTLYRLFGWVMNSVKTRWSQSMRFIRTPSGHHRVQSLAFKALTNWPMGFYDFLCEFLEDEVRRHNYRYCCDFNGPVYLRIKSAFAFWICGFQDRPEFSFVQEAVDRFLVVNNIRICSDYGSTPIYLKADEGLRKITCPIA